MYDTASVGHCCKVVFKYYAIDHLLLYLPADKTRKQLLTRIVKSAKPDFQDGDGDLMSVLKDYWYTWCSLCLFLNDRAKWEGLPRMARLLVILLEIMAHQYISSDVSPFHVATYAAAVFCLESLARSQLGELYSHTSDLAGTSEKYDCVLSSEGSKGTLYSHQNCHAVHDLERTDPLPHGFTDEHKIDQAIAKFTKIGVRLQGKRGLENIMRLFLSNEQTLTKYGLESRKNKYTDVPERKPVMFYPCYVTYNDKIGATLEKFVTRSSSKAYSHLVRRHETVKNCFFIITDKLAKKFGQGPITGPVEPYLNNSDWVVFCSCGLCSSLSV